MVGQPSGALRGPHVQRWEGRPLGLGAGSPEPLQEALRTPGPGQSSGRDGSEAGGAGIGGGGGCRRKRSAPWPRALPAWPHPRHSAGLEMNQRRASLSREEASRGGGEGLSRGALPVCVCVGDKADSILLLRERTMRRFKLPKRSSSTGSGFGTTWSAPACSSSFCASARSSSGSR